MRILALLILSLLLLMHPAVAQHSPCDSSGTVYNFPEVLPQFPGGNEKMMTFLADEIHYPELAREVNIHGYVYVDFIVNRDGCISHVQLARGIGGGCDEESIRVVKLMPRWKPALINGKTVRAQCRLPIQFCLRPCTEQNQTLQQKTCP